MRTNWLLVAATVVMGIIGVVDAALDAVLNVHVWTGGDLELFTDRASWINIIKVGQCLTGSQALTELAAVCTRISISSYNP